MQFGTVQYIDHIKKYLNINCSSHIPLQNGMAWLTQHISQGMDKSQVDRRKYQNLQDQATTVIRHSKPVLHVIDKGAMLHIFWFHSFFFRLCLFCIMNIVYNLKKHHIPEIASTIPTSWDVKPSPRYFLLLTAQSENIWKWNLRNTLTCEFAWVL